LSFYCKVVKIHDHYPPQSIIKNISKAILI
jgi:hypothetical protein